MKLLLHACCGPCTVYPWSILKNDHSIAVFSFNPNIHPYKEFVRRKETLTAFCDEERIPVLGPIEYGLTEYLQRVVGDEQNRCRHCYSWRMEESAAFAAANGFDGFTSTLLYSKYQRHSDLKRFGLVLAEKYNVDFLYKDFREGWQQGIDESIERGMYRQPYCGCIFSEQERYDKKLRAKKRKKGKK